MHGGRNQRRLLGIALLSLPGLSGCFKASTVVQVNPDGRGRIVESVALRKDVIAMFSSFGDSIGAKKGVREEDILPLQQFRKKTPEYGEGVTYLGGKKTQEGDYVRATAEYAFRDITKVRLKTSNAPEVGKESGLQRARFIRFAILQSVNTGVSNLTIKLPAAEAAVRKPEVKQPDRAEPETTRPASPDQEQMLMQFFKDAEMSICVECGKKVLSTTATHHDGNRITLLHLPFAKLLENKETLDEMKKLSIEPKGFDEVKRLLKGVAGIEVELQPEVMVEYR